MPSRKRKRVFLPDSSAVDGHRLYLISCGPGDPGLITVKGLARIAECPFVLSPDQLAASFADQLDGKEVASPFTMDRETLLSWVEERLLKGPVALLIPGDFSIFCPFQSFVADFAGRCEVIPGISTHVAAMALIKKSTDVPEVAHTAVITSPRAYSRDGGNHYYRLGGKGKTLVLYMNDRPLAQLADELMNAYAPDTPIALFEELGSAEQAVTISTLERLVDAFAGRDPFGIGADSPEPKLTLVVVGEAVTKDEEPRWWNRRYETIWKPRGMR